MLIYTRVPKHKPRKKRKADVSVAENYVNIRLTNRTVKFDRTELSKIKTFVPPPAYRREQVYHPSLNSNVGHTSRKEPIFYTGNLIKGIATMHKSNAVPVINEEEMISISRMRRG